MTDVSLALPLFALILLGYAVGRIGRIPTEGVRSLDFFVSYCALPAFFFGLVAGARPGELDNWSFVLTVTFATYCAFAVAFTLGALVNRGNIAVATVHGLVGASANTGYLAPAFTLAVLGPDAAVPTALIFCLDTVLIQALVPLMMAAGGAEREPFLRLLRTIALRLAVHPFVLAVLAGIAANLLGLRPAGMLSSFLAWLSAAAPAAALFALGMVGALRPLPRVAPELPALLVVKLVGHPLAVYLLLSWVGDFPPVWTYTALLIAAMPPAVGVYATARHYGVQVSRASAAVILGAVVSIVTVSGLLYLIGSGRLPPDLFPGG